MWKETPYPGFERQFLNFAVVFELLFFWRNPGGASLARCNPFNHNSSRAYSIAGGRIVASFYSAFQSKLHGLFLPPFPSAAGAPGVMTAAAGAAAVGGGGGGATAAAATATAAAFGALSTMTLCCIFDDVS